MLCFGSIASAQQPGQQPTNLNFFNIKPYGFSLNFTPAQCDGFLILRSESPISFNPQDGVEYQKGQGVAPGVKVFASGISSSASIKECLAGSTYYFAIYSFNNSGAAIDYKSDNPLTGSIDVPPGGPGNYYANISNDSPTFLADLKQRLNTGRVFQSYTPGYINNLMNNFYLRDTVGGMVVSICQYTGEVFISSPPYAWWGTSGADGQFTREHSLPKSWMPTGGNTSNQDGADYHNLFPVNQDKANSKRSNYPYGIVQTPTFQYLGGKFGTNSQGITVYEPRNDIKGDVARAQFYMMACYNGNGGGWGYQSGLQTYAQQQSQDVLKIWHLQDPPDAFEKTRNEYIYSVQYNRNPFIDYPELADCINFNDMTLYAGCTITLDTEDDLPNTNVVLYPNPASDIIYIGGINETIREVSVIDINGKVIIQENIGTLPENGIVSLDISKLSNGLYSVLLKGSHSFITKKIVVNK